MEPNDEFILRSQEEIQYLEELVSKTLSAAQVYNVTMSGRVGGLQSNLLVSLLKLVKDNVDCIVKNNLHN